MEAEFEFKGQKFKLSKIDAFKQFHVIRKLGPILGSILPSFKDFKALESSKKHSALSESDKFDKIAKIAQPFLKGMSELSKEDSEMVLLGLLSAAEVYQPEHKLWARVAKDDVMLMQNLNLPTMFMVAYQAMMFNLSNFF